MCLKNKQELDFPLTESRFEAGGLRFDIGVDPEDAVVRVRAVGDLNGKSNLHLAKHFSSAALKSNCNLVLCDLTAARLTDSVLGIYEYPARLQQQGVSRALRIAVVYENDEQKHRFWETVSRNRGFMTRVFRDTQEALDWLTDPSRY